MKFGKVHMGIVNESEPNMNMNEIRHSSNTAV